MNNGPRPPVPGLIPISALRKKSANDCCNSSPQDQDSSPQRLNSGGGGGDTVVVGKEVMGEQRSRRTGTQAPAPVDLIDTARSRGPTAGPQAPNRKTKSEQRHRKSEKRREHKSVRNKRSSSSSGDKQKWPSSAERPVNPRVNPIFVWVRQEDTRIVDVKCEDYDKRNRILLTKTAHGWRAIPRTETWVPTLKPSTDNDIKRARKARKSNKVKRKSTAVQVENDIDGEESHNPPVPSSPTWTSSGDVESHLPSHTIHVNRHCSSSPERHQVTEPSNDSLRLDATSSYHDNIHANKMNATSPLDNLLAVAEFEFNQKIQSGEWNDTSTIDTSISSPIKVDYCEEKVPENEAIEPNPIDFLIKCDLEEKENPKTDEQEKYYNDERRSDEIDYDEEEEENNLAMTDILDRLEQSLRTPEPKSPEIPTDNQCSLEESQKSDAEVLDDEEEVEETKIDNCTNDILYDNPTESEENPQEEDVIEIKEIDEPESSQTDKILEEPTDLTIRSSTTCDIQEEGPKDLRTTKVLQNSIDYEKITPTDLRISTEKGYVCSSSPRPYSRSSETVQSPQPSGLPPVPPSPDVFPPFGNTKSNPKSVFLETLLSSPQKELQPQSKTDVQMEPLDLGKCRKSASPTVTCSEEVNKRTFAEADESEPKKIKVEAITLKNILSAETAKSNEKNQLLKEDATGSTFLEQSKLLELLTTDTEGDPALQLKQLQLDPSVDLPDPLLIPKENLSQVLTSPKKEIVRLLTQRPELRLPDALSYPHLLQDPNILVITLAQLQTIIQKQSQVLPPSSSEEKVNIKKSDNFSKTIPEKKPKPKQEEKPKNNVKLNPLIDDSSRVRCNSPNKNFSRVEEARNEMYNNESLNQMMWLPYLQQLEAAAIAFGGGGGSDILKGFNFPFLSLPGNQLPGMGPMIAANRFPPHPQAPIPFQQHFDYNSLFEYPNWQEALHQANYLRSKNQFDLNTKNIYGGHPERHHDTLKRSHSTSQKPYAMNRNYSNKGNVLGGNYNTSMRDHGVRPSLQIPQYHPPNPPKNQTRKNSANFLMQPEIDSTVPTKQSRNHFEGGLKNIYAASVQNMFSHHYPDASTNDKVGSHEKSLQQKTVTSYDGSRKGNPDSSSMQPIDLSTSQVTSNKARDRSHYDTAKHQKHLPKQDDVPEVGSTTASLEEMTGHVHDSQKYLWHPLFGNQKPSSSSWNWATLAATGE